MHETVISDPAGGIAIVGMSGRFPGAPNLAKYWENLARGVESISVFGPEELAAAGVDPALAASPDYVGAAGVIDDIDLFDAGFFGFNPREAEVTDPQQRIFLECVWEAIEDAGYDLERYDGVVGLFAGSHAGTYRQSTLESHPELLETVGGQAIVGNDRDFLATTVSYRLNLRGPSVTIQTACSTSLVAVGLACRSLESYESDMVLAGGVSIAVPQTVGYVYRPGGVMSPDGHCRPFDARAGGSVPGHGAGVFVLKRLADAIADRDRIRAVILGSALNNDGAVKVGFSAPGVEGQARVIAMAHALSGVDADAIGYVEAHGSGTPMGDPIEIAALEKAFRSGTSRKHYCAIGAVKANIGHLGAAAGAAGLIKTVLALEHGQIPPSLNFERPNPEIAFGESPFYVNTRLAPWTSDGQPRRAGVSAFGIGGTNAHVVLEEAPRVEPSPSSRCAHLLLMSAKSPAALDAAVERFADHLTEHPGDNIADFAYTSQVGRRPFGQRAMLISRTPQDAIDALRTRDPRRLLFGAAGKAPRPVIFMFSGLGDQYVNMGRQLYLTEPTFRAELDRCFDMLMRHLNIDARELLYPPADEATAGRVAAVDGTGASPQLDLRRMLNRPGASPTSESAAPITQTWLAHPVVFSVEFALAQLWMEWGVRPHALVGYSLGEYVAACLAGVLSLEDALRLVIARARMVQSLPGGAMLAVPLPEREVRDLLGPSLSLAAVNGPSLCVVAGPHRDVAELEGRLNHRDIVCRRLQTTHGFHSRMMRPAAAELLALTRSLTLEPPRIPYLSNVTGTWITAAQATDPAYWATHLCETVRFSDCVGEAWRAGGSALLEIGPGHTLCSLALQHPESRTQENPVALPTLRQVYEPGPDFTFLLNTVGKLWLAGAAMDWDAFHGVAPRRRCALPTYPFERSRYWVSPAGSAGRASRSNRSPAAADGLEKRSRVSDWFYVPSWSRSADPADGGDEDASPRRWLLLLDEGGVGGRVAARLRADGEDVVTVSPGPSFGQCGDFDYCLDRRTAGDYASLLTCLRERRWMPDRIVHFSSLTSASQDRGHGAETLDEHLESDFYSLVFIVQALGREDGPERLRIDVVTDSVYEVTGEERLQPHKGLLLGLCRVIPQEYPSIACRIIDIGGAPSEAAFGARPVDRLVADLRSPAAETSVAYRGRYRWTQAFHELRRPGRSGHAPAPLREHGVYLITGGFGRVGYLLAEHLARSEKARLVLVGRSSDARGVAPTDRAGAASERVAKIDALRALGAEVLVAAADVADEEQMATVVAEAHRRFGGLHGVLHAAGVTGAESFTPIQELTPAECERHFRAKVRGVYVLEKVLRGERPDFCLLFSSLATALGGLGFGAYAAANAFMDVFAQQHARSSDVPWLSVDWDTWPLPEERDDRRAGVSIAHLVMTPEEAVEAFRQALAQGGSRLVVSLADLHARMEQWVERPMDSPGAGDTSLTFHPRPRLPNPFVAPRNRLERALVEIWQEALGLGEIGIHDNFFELGGHSLLGTRVMSRIRRTFHVELTVRTLFERPTVAEFAEALEHEGAAAALAAP